MKEAILLAGGFGTRLQKVVPDLPKPMAPVNGRPFIEYVMDFLISNQVRRFILSVGYMHEIFASHFAEYYKGCPVLFSVEHEPLGTGGGIKKSLRYAENEQVLVVNADTLFRIDITSMFVSHKKTNADLTMALRNLSDASRYGSVEINKEMQVTGFHEKSSEKRKGYINGGVYVFNRDFFHDLELPEKFSFEKDCMGKYYKTLNITGFPSQGYFLDIGVPEDYKKAQHDLQGS